MERFSAPASKLRCYANPSDLLRMADIQVSFTRIGGEERADILIVVARVEIGQVGPGVFALAREAQAEQARRRITPRAIRGLERDQLGRASRLELHFGRAQLVAQQIVPGGVVRGDHLAGEAHVVGARRRASRRVLFGPRADTDAGGAAAAARGLPLLPLIGAIRELVRADGGPAG